MAYVVIEGGLAQFQSDDVDVIDLDFMDYHVTDDKEEARDMLALCEKHGLDYPAQRIRNWLGED